MLNDLKSEDGIKLYLNASLKDYLDDGYFNSFFRALEIVIKAKDTVSGFVKKVGMSRVHLYSLFKREKEPKFFTIIKIFKNGECRLAKDLKWVFLFCEKRIWREFQKYSPKTSILKFS